MHVQRILQNGSFTDYSSPARWFVWFGLCTDQLETVSLSVLLLLSLGDSMNQKNVEHKKFNRQAAGP